MREGPSLITISSAAARAIVSVKKSHILRPTLITDYDLFHVNINLCLRECLEAPLKASFKDLQVPIPICAKVSRICWWSGQAGELFEILYHGGTIAKDIQGVAGELLGNHLSPSVHL